MATFKPSADYDTMVSANSDGPWSNAPFSLGRNNRWGYLCLWGPGNTGARPLNLGLIQTFSVQETNDTAYLPQAGTDWLEPQIGTRMWRGSCVRYHVRGADMKLMLRRAYTASGGTPPKDIDFRFMPFVIAYFFDYSPPNGVQISSPSKSYESVTWVYHKILITSYTNDLITGPQRLLEERFDFIGAGEEFQDLTQGSSGGITYRSNPAVWRGDYYGIGTSKTTVLDPSGTNKLNTASSNIASGGATGEGSGTQKPAAGEGTGGTQKAAP